MMEAITDRVDPQVESSIRVCDNLYLEKVGRMDRHLKYCVRILKEVEELDEKSLKHICRSYCKRWHPL